MEKVGEKDEERRNTAMRGTEGEIRGEGKVG